MTILQTLALLALPLVLVWAVLQMRAALRELAAAQLERSAAASRRIALHDAMMPLLDDLYACMLDEPSQMKVPARQALDGCVQLQRLVRMHEPMLSAGARGAYENFMHCCIEPAADASPSPRLRAQCTHAPADEAAMYSPNVARRTDVERTYRQLRRALAEDAGLAIPLPG